MYRPTTLRLVWQYKCLSHWLQFYTFKFSVGISHTHRIVLSKIKIIIVKNFEFFYYEQVLCDG